MEQDTAGTFMDEVVGMSVIIHGLNMPRRSAFQVMIYPDGQAVVTTVSKKTFVCEAKNEPKASAKMFGSWKVLPDGGPED